MATARLGERVHYAWSTASPEPACRAQRAQQYTCRLPALSPRALEGLIQTISQRIGAYLEGEGLLVRDIENPYLQLEDSDDSSLNDLLGHSGTYRIAVGPQAGRKAFTLQTVPACPHGRIRLPRRSIRRR